MIQIPHFIDTIFTTCDLDPDCNILDFQMQTIANTIKELIDADCQESAATLFLQLTAATAQHFISEEHWCYFDDLYSPDYTLQYIYEWFKDLSKEKRLRDSARQILINGIEEIKEMESVCDYGYPSIFTKALD